MWLIPSQLRVSAPASACSTKPCGLAATTSDGTLALRCIVSGKATLQPFCWRGWKTRAWSQRLFTAATLPTSTVNRSLAAWTYSLRAFPASRGHAQASSEVSPTSDGCGMTCTESSCRFNLHWCSSKMSPALFPGVDCITSSEALPKAGSMRSGFVSQRPAWVPATDASECSSWPTIRPCSGERSSGAKAKNWPSPRGEDSESCGNQPNATDSLTGATALWGPPEASERANRGARRVNNPASNRGGQRSLGDDVQQWATPNATDSEAAGGAQQKSLTNDCNRFWHQARKPSGTTSRSTSGRRLNPAFTCWLMGWPWWWTRAAPISFAAREMELWRRAQQQLLLNLCGEQ